MMAEQKTFYDYYYPKCVWSEQPQNPISKNIHSIGKPSSMANNPEFISYGPKYLQKTVLNLQYLPQKVLARLHKLKKIQKDDHIACINTFGEKYKQEKYKVVIITNYFSKSMNLKKASANQFCRFSSKIASIFHKVAMALDNAATKYQVAHLRLTSSAILVKIPQQNADKATWMTQVCDFGIGKQKKDRRSINYMHPEIVNLQVNPYDLGAQQCFKYDIWSFGVILFQILYQKLPFDFSKGRISLHNCKKALHKENVNPDTIFGGLILKCFEFLDEPFKNWGQVVKMLQGQFCFSEIEKKPIEPIFIAHVRTMYLFSKIFILIRSKVQQNYEEPQSNPWVNANRMRNFSQLLLFWCLKYHRQFRIYFDARCHILGPEALVIINRIGNSLQNQHNFLKSKNSQVFVTMKDLRVEEFRDQFMKFLIAISMMDDRSNQQIVLKLVINFSKEFTKLLEKGKICLQDDSKDREAYINVIYESNYLKELAETQFNFDYEAHRENMLLFD